MNIFKLCQYKMVLDVLLKIKYCLDRDVNSTGDFFINKRIGICGHVSEYIKYNHIDYDFLSQAFIDLNLDSTYPVECSFEKTFNYTNIVTLYRSQTNHYDKSTDIGRFRIELINKLIQYYQNELTIECTETVFQYFYKLAVIKIQNGLSIDESVWSVIDFITLSPEMVECIVKEDPSLGVVYENGHCSINYPDDLSLVNIVTTNLQERLKETLETEY